MKKLLILALLVTTPLFAQDSKKKTYHTEYTNTIVGDVGIYMAGGGLASFLLALAVNESAEPDQYEGDNNERDSNQLQADLVTWGGILFITGYSIFIVDAYIIVPIKTGKHNPPLFRDSEKWGF